MTWFRGIALVVLLALSSMPVGGTVCALLCAAPSTSSASHHGTEQCEQSAHASSGAQVSSVSEHDCSKHDASIGEVATTAMERTGFIAIPALLVVGTIESENVSQQDARDAFDDTSPGAAAPPTTRPSILRI